MTLQVVRAGMCIENEVQTNHLKASSTYNILIYNIYVYLFDLYCYAGTMPRNNPSLLQLAKIGQQLLMILDGRAGLSYAASPSAGWAMAIATCIETGTVT